ncbi:hypothetical protein LINGRAHAP2_LOCUS2685 [Linum grandiflorum]
MPTSVSTAIPEFTPLTSLSLVISASSSAGTADLLRETPSPVLDLILNHLLPAPPALPRLQKKQTQSHAPPRLLCPLPAFPLLNRSAPVRRRRSIVIGRTRRWWIFRDPVSMMGRSGLFCRIGVGRWG